MAAETHLPPKDTATSARLVDDARPNDGPFEEVRRNAEEARNALRQYLTAQLLRIQSLVRLAILYGALCIVAAVIAIFVVASATVLLLVGLSEGLATVLGGRQWAGDLIIGGVVVLGVPLGGYIAVRWLLASARARTISSFEKPRSAGSPR